MREFFKRWRQKMGILTLAMACALTSSWIRSLFVSDLVLFRCLWRQQLIYVSNGRVNWIGISRSYVNYKWGLFSGRLGTNTILNEFISRLETYEPNEVGQDLSLKFFYWSIVLPLTLLSAYLLLSKPRVAQPKAEPTRR